MSSKCWWPSWKPCSWAMDMETGSPCRRWCFSFRWQLAGSMACLCAHSSPCLCLAFEVDDEAAVALVSTCRRSGGWRARGCAAHLLARAGVCSHVHACVCVWAPMIGQLAPSLPATQIKRSSSPPSSSCSTSSRLLLFQGRRQSERVVQASVEQGKRAIHVHGRALDIQVMAFTLTSFLIRPRGSFRFQGPHSRTLLTERVDGQSSPSPDP